VDRPEGKGNFAGNSSVVGAMAQSHGGEFIQEAASLVWKRHGREVLRLDFNAGGDLSGDFSVHCGAWPLTGRAGAVRFTAWSGKAVVLPGDALRFAGESLLGDVVIEGAASPRAGLIRFTAELPAGTTASIRYFYPGEAGLARIVYPVMVDGAGAMQVAVEVDPRQPFGPQTGRWRIAESATGATSGLLTVEGGAVMIRPIGGNSSLVPQWDAVEQAGYLAPDGEWTASVAGATGPVRVLCGLSTAEHMLTTPVFPARFIADQPAFAPGFAAVTPPGATHGPVGLTATIPGSAHPATTAWAYLPTAVGGPEGVYYGYYSQPQRGGWFAADAQFFQPQSLLAAEMFADAPGRSGPSGFPLGLYGVLGAPDAADAAIMTRFEADVLTPARLDAIYGLAWPSPSGDVTLPQTPADATSTLVTPQGLRLELAGNSWQRLVFATSDGQSLALAAIAPQLALAFQGGQLFLVIDRDGFASLVKQGLCSVVFDALAIRDWTFYLDPAGANWSADTVMIVKFARATLPELAADQSRWMLPSLVTSDATGAQKAILDAISVATAAGADTNYAYFAETVLGDWNGVLFLNVGVPAASFPAQLMALTAGMTGPLQAHHFGVDLSPVVVENGLPVMRDAKLFGLILHEDLSDLTYHGSAYDFKTQSLRVLFANSDIAAFSSRIELLVGQLFGERSLLVDSSTGDNIVLTGTMQKRGDTEVYSFSFSGANGFSIQSEVLQSVQVTRADMITVALGPSGQSGAAGMARIGPPVQAGATGQVYVAQFPLAGTVSFQEQPGFDLFSFGPTGMTGPLGPSGPVGATGLRFSNLQVQMQFTEGDTNLADRTFSFDATRATLELPASSARPGSLYDGFPLTATGFLQGGAGPSTLGYLPLETPPLTTGALGASWFGLAMDLALGTRGGLAGMAPLTASLLTAWSPGEQVNTATLAMLPGTKGIKELSLQGPLKLEMGDSSITWTADANGDPAYVMRFNDIALKLFGLRFPSGGRVNAALFGDPNPARKSSSLGWYAAYQKNAPAGGSAGLLAAETEAVPSRSNGEVDNA
jgi:hypothetical protein